MDSLTTEFSTSNPENSDAAVFASHIAERKRINADPRSWEWPEASGDSLGHIYFEKASDKWQNFSQKWRAEKVAAQAGSILDTCIPFEQRTLPKSKKIYVRQSYLDTLGRIWLMAAYDYKTALVTGQPGIGKTIFLWYLLIRLLQDGQIVFFYMQDNDPLLFYFDTVFTLHNSVGKRALFPTCLCDEAFIWSLFDIEKSTDDHPHLAANPISFTVQAPFPHRDFVRWARSRICKLTTGLSLWTREELRAAMSTCEEIEFLRKELRENWSTNQGFRQRLLPVYSEERSPASVDELLDAILDRAIEVFGLVPRDVYDAMHDFDTVQESLQDAIDISSKRLEEIVTAFGRMRLFDDVEVSHRVICINPSSFTLAGWVDSWSIAFRSPWVGAHIARQLEQKHGEDVGRLYKLFKDIPSASSMLGNLFEVLTHRALTQEADANSPWTLSVMNKVSDTKASDEPTFTAVVDRVPAAVSLPKMARKKQYFSTLPDELKIGVYYIPEASTFPLIDSFTVDIDATSKSATLWLFQMTKSRGHKGSAAGYKMISDVMVLVENIFNVAKDGEPARKKAKVVHTITLCYVLVCPVGLPIPQSWKMPRGWDDDTVPRNVYFLEMAF